jgi:chromate transporter
MLKPPATTRRDLPELVRLFLRLGLTAFGGPAAHVAMMEDEVVVRRKWLTRQQFLDLLGATNLIPGPNSTEMAIYIGLRRAGWLGLVAAGVCFILPAALLVSLIAWAYLRYGALPQAAGILCGVKPVVIAIILQAIWRLGRTALKTRFLVALGAVAVALGFLGTNPLVLLFGAGLAAAFARRITARKPPLILPLLSVAATQAAPATALAAAAPVALWPLFLVFLKVGALLFGSGYVLLAFLRADLVEHLHWLTEGQLLDAVAVGQVTPGPLFTTATFIGYLLAGPSGAVVATVGIFLPAFFLVAASGPLIPRLRKSAIAAAVLDGVNVGALALMVVVATQLISAAIIDRVTLVLALASAVALLRYKVNSTWLVLIGAAVGLLTCMLTLPR